VYKFNLQVLLDYRTRIEEGLQLELSHFQRELDNVKQLFFSYQKEKSYYEEELVKKEEKEIDLEEGLLYRDYLRGMRIRIGEQRELVAKAKIDFEKKQKELLEATKKKKVLEKVKEKDWKRFMVALERKERIMIDEMGIRRYQRLTLERNNKST
jgi:flagellar FliJ protein